MKNKYFLAGMLLLSSSVFASVPWEYSGESGPDSWAMLSPEYAACNGNNQSPINLTGFIEAELTPIMFNYNAGSSEIINNGHTVQINTVAGSSISIDGIQFDLKQFHFHAPSENLIEGKSYPLEAHLVHADTNGNLAVVAVMFTEGEASTVIENAWAQMPQVAGENIALTSAILPLDILPEHRNY